LHVFDKTQANKSLIMFCSPKLIVIL